MKTPNASLRAIKVNPRCSGQVHFKGSRPGPRNENTEYGCAFGVLRAPSIIIILSTEPRECLVQIGPLIVSAHQAQMSV